MPRSPGIALGGYHAPRNRWTQPSNEPPMQAHVALAIDEKMADWLVGQSHAERKSISALIRRAIRFEKERVKALGTAPSLDDLEYGRV